MVLFFHARLLLERRIDLPRGDPPSCLVLLFVVCNLASFGRFFFCFNGEVMFTFSVQGLGENTLFCYQKKRQKCCAVPESKIKMLSHNGSCLQQRYSSLDIILQCYPQLNLSCYHKFNRLCRFIEIDRNFSFISYSYNLKLLCFILCCQFSKTLQIQLQMLHLQYYSMQLHHQVAIPTFLQCSIFGREFPQSEKCTQKTRGFISVRLFCTAWHVPYPLMTSQSADTCALVQPLDLLFGLGKSGAKAAGERRGVLLTMV